MFAANVWTMHDVGAAWLVLWLVFLGAVVWAVVWAARDGQQGRNRSTADSPLELLDRRLADGTLTPEDYLSRRRLLTTAPTNTPAGAGNGTGPTEPRTPEEVGA